MAFKSQVIIRRADRDDLETVVSWMEDPAFQRFLYGDRTQSPKQIRRQIVGMLGRSSTVGMPQVVHFVADHKKHGPVGLFSVVNISCGVVRVLPAQPRPCSLASVRGHSTRLPSAAKAAQPSRRQWSPAIALRWFCRRATSFGTTKGDQACCCVQNPL